MIILDIAIYRNMTISYVAYSIYKFWVMSENKKVNYTQNCLLKFIKNDLFKRTCYIGDKEFHKMCDKIILKI